MMDEHGRSERRRHVPDVLEREHKRLPTDRLEPEDPPSHVPDGEGALEGFAPVEPDVGYWARLDTGHRGATVAAIVAGVALVGAIAGAAWYLTTLREPERTVRRQSSSVVPSEVPSSSAATTGSAETSASGSATATPAAPAAPVLRRAPLIAYRAGGSIWVSGEHGGSPRSVYGSTSGVFSLSPDGKRIALVDPAVGALRIVDVASGSSTLVGEAIPVRPDWAPDSTFVVFTRSSGGGHSEEVARVAANGTGVRVLEQGWQGRVMPDGSTVIAAPVQSAGGSVGVAVLSDGRRIAAPGRAHVTEVRPASGGLYYADAGGLATTGGALSAPSLRWIGYDGTGSRTVVAKPASSAGASFADLQVSPDGTWLVYAEVGDDGYSRLFAMRTSGGKPVSLTPRLDGYFMGWSADGAELFVTEGNAVQGEATRVSAMHPDGTGRRIIVEGGGL